MDLGVDGGGNMNKSIKEKLFDAYDYVSKEIMMGGGLTSIAWMAYRNKKYAIFVEARKLDKDGYLASEQPFVLTRGK